MSFWQKIFLVNMYESFSRRYSTLLLNLFFTSAQIYGLLFLNWSGLYIVYLYWIELFFLSLYTIVRFKQLLKSDSRIRLKKYSIIRWESDDAKTEMSVLIFSRVVFLSFYLFLIGVSAVPYEHHFMYVKSAGKFFENLIISEPLFIMAALFIVFYYVRMIMGRLDQSLEGLVEFSFNLDPLESRIISPGLAIITIPLLLGFYFLVPSADDIPHSNLYLFAIWLLVLRVFLDILLIFRIRREMEERGL